ncbi:MAG: hypothetical protein M0R22_00165 [Dehalococcoidia bacterium]|jgi:hypothetical protein|nr:hypothetical protein [Dehalococcoidia bacterium]
MIWLLWFLVGFALVTLIVRESIFAWPRRFLFNVLGSKAGGWLACGPCAAFWVGVAVGVPDVGILAQWLPVWTISSSIAVAVTGHVLGGLLLLAAVRLVQTFSHSTLAVIAEEEAAKSQMLRGTPVERTMAMWQSTMNNAIAAQFPLSGEVDDPDDDDPGGHA